MAHKGKLYPVYNPGRKFVRDAFWPYWFPTEFKWQVDKWYGVIASGAPASGRGLVPISYDPTRLKLVYGLTLNGILGPPFTVGMAFYLDEPNFQQFQDIQIFVSGVPQTISSPFSRSVSDESAFNFPALAWRPITGSTAYFGNYFNCSAYLWSDPAPPPPASSPF